MRILFLLTQDLSSPSGLGRYLPFVKSLGRLGHHVHIVATHSNFAQLTSKLQMVDGVSVHYVAQMHVQKSGNTKRYFNFPSLLKNIIVSSFQLTRAALNWSPELIVIGKPHPMNSIAGLIVRRFSHCLILTDVDDDEAGSSHFQSSWQKWIVAWFARNIPRVSDLVTTNTYFTMKKMENQRVPEEKIYYLPNGIDPARFAHPDETMIGRLRMKLGLEGRRVVLFIGSLSKASHPVDLLIDAMVAVRETNPEAFLLVVGGGEDLSVFQSQVNALGLSDDVKFIGKVLPDEVVAYYALADLSIDPVNDDDAARGRCPLKLFESWVCGVPFITADVGDRRLFVGNPPAVVIVEPGSSSALASAIQQILANSALSTSLQTQGLKRVANYQWNLLAQGFQSFLESRLQNCG